MKSKKYRNPKYAVAKCISQFNVPQETKNNDAIGRKPDKTKFLSGDMKCVLKSEVLKDGIDHLQQSQRRFQKITEQEKKNHKTLWSNDF